MRAIDSWDDFTSTYRQVGHFSLRTSVIAKLHYFAADGYKIHFISQNRLLPEGGKNDAFSGRVGDLRIEELRRAPRPRVGVRSRVSDAWCPTLILEHPPCYLRSLRPSGRPAGRVRGSQCPPVKWLVLLTRCYTGRNQVVDSSEVPKGAGH